MTTPQLRNLLENSDSLRSGLARVSLRTLGEYIQVYDLDDVEVKEAQTLLLRKVADTNDFIRSEAVESLRALTLKQKVPSIQNYLAVLKAGALTTSVQGSQNSASTRLAIAKALSDVSETGYAT